MLERLKDFLYDISDIAVSLLIIAVIFFSVSWKITDTLDFDISSLGSDQTTSQDLITEDQTDTDQSDEENVIEIIPNVSEDSSDNSSDASTDTTSENSGTDDQSTSSEGSETSSQPLVLNTFTVSQGQSGYAIGQSLADEGYVESADVFVSRLVERELDRKLFAGDFKLSTSDDLDTIIDVLTGQGR